MFPPEACSLVVSEIGAALNLLPRSDRPPTIVVLPESTQAPIGAGQAPGEAAGPASGPEAVTTGRWPDLATSAGYPAARQSQRCPISQGPGAAEPGWIACLASDRDGAVTLIDLTDGTPLHSIPLGRKPRAIAVTPDGATACVANYGDGTITLISISTAVMAHIWPTATGSGLRNRSFPA